MEMEEDRTRWRAALKEMGASNVALRLDRIEISPDAEVPSIGDRPPWPKRGFVEKWLKRQEDRRYRCGLTLTVVAALAGILAAFAAWIGSWSEIKAFFRVWLN